MQTVIELSRLAYEDMGILASVYLGVASMDDAKEVFEDEMMARIGAVVWIEDVTVERVSVKVRQGDRPVRSHNVWLLEAG